MSRSALVNKTDWGNAVDDQIFSTNLDDSNILSVVNVETQEQGRFADVMGVAAPGTTMVESRSWMMSLANIRPKKGTGLALPKQPFDDGSKSSSPWWDSGSVHLLRATGGPRTVFAAAGPPGSGCLATASFHPAAAALHLPARRP